MLKRSRRRSFALAAIAVLVMLFGWQIIPQWTSTENDKASIPTRLVSALDADSNGAGVDHNATKALESLRSRNDLNVLFILVDTLRADHLGAYGYERDTSPTIDRLAANGIRFANHMAQSSWTKASMASLWTGLYPVRTGVIRYSHAVSQDAIMPAEIFQDAGIHTAAIWRNGWVAPNFGFAQGFDVYHRPRPARVAQSVRRENPSIKLDGTDEDIILSAIEFLRANREDQWFLYLHMMDVHQYVHDEDTALFGTGYRDLYDNAIRWDDRLLDFLFKELDRLNLRERTLIALVSDHGEAFGEHGLEGHAHDVHAEVTTTPFVLGLPFPLESGVVVNQPTENVDVWPTLLDLTGLTPLSDPDGRSRVDEILSALGDERLWPTGQSFAHLDQTWGRTQEAPRPVISVKEGPFRLIFHVMQPDQTELYNIEEDPLEQVDISKDHPEDVARLTSLVEDYQARPSAPWGEDTPIVELDDMQLNQLRALGYQID